MNAEIISIGDEMTTGQRLDTNSQWISQRLCELGIEVHYHSTVGDDIQANRNVFSNAINRASVVVATGGLGPTADDLTREVIAGVMNKDLEFDQGSFDHIFQLFQSRNREMPEKNRIQAMFPKGSKPIHNPEGTAPGIFAEIQQESGHRCLLFALPGVPAEMKEMFTESVQTELLNRFQERRTIRHRRIKCFGIGESSMEEKLPNLIERGREPIVGITVHQATITLRITALDRDEKACEKQMQPTVDFIYEQVGDLAFGEEDDELQDAVIRLLKENNKSLSIIETNSGGLASQWLEEVPDHQTVFKGGCVISAAELSDNPWASIDSDLINQYGLASAEVAKEMAVQLRAKTGTDFALALAPFPELNSDTQGPTLFYAGLASADEDIAQGYQFGGHSSIRKSRSTKQALNLLRLKLLRN